MAKNVSYYELAEKFSDNIFLCAHQTDILSGAKTLDYLVNFTIEAYKRNLSVALFIERLQDSEDTFSIMEKMVKYEPLFYSQLKKNAEFLLKMNFGRSITSYNTSKFQYKKKSLDKISIRSTRELLFENDIEKTLYAIFLAEIFPEENFRPVLIYMPTVDDAKTDDEKPLLIYGAQKR